MVRVEGDVDFGPAFNVGFPVYFCDDFINDDSVGVSVLPRCGDLDLDLGFDDMIYQYKNQQRVN